MENNLMSLKLANNISNWLQHYLKDNGVNCFVIGVSGGVDSAVSSTLCARTGAPTYVLNIPIRSKQENTNMSTLHCDWLCDKYDNVKQITIDATDAYNMFEDIFADTEDHDLLANANSKSRMRMMILYYMATSRRGIVVGTGNKVEDFGVGFYTKYGDGGVDISPIADLTKTQVRELASTLGVEKEILNAPPTDGLWEDSRTDESQIGASYEELEWAMAHIEDNTSEELTGRQKEVLDIYLSFNTKNKHKMNPIPVYKLGE
jgi:NAD+ synthase